MMKKYIIQGRFWSAGDDIYIESKNDQGKWNEINLNSFIKENIKQESNKDYTHKFVINEHDFKEEY